MKKIILLLFFFISSHSFSQDTFSIVAVDSITGEIGSAGASCVTVSLPFAPHGVQLICDVVAGVGAVNTQASWSNVNKTNAHNRLIAGDSALAIINYVISNDAGNDSSVRQYGAVTYNNGHPQSAGFTGQGCMDYKNHITGPGYSIQGNILLGQEILDSMEAKYLNTQGSLSDKLMAALQGANVVGADSRCAPYGLSSLSSYIRVAKPGDTTGTYFLDLYMAYTSALTWAVDPIDSLQAMYNTWLSTGIQETRNERDIIRGYEVDGYIVLEVNAKINKALTVELYDNEGRCIYSQKSLIPSFRIPKEKLGIKGGMCTYVVRDNNNIFSSGIIPLFYFK